MDSWFEAGSMPFAQFHYPFENVEKFEANFPGDFIAEYVGQVRAWFYYLHAISIGLFGKSSFKNVIVTGTLAGNDGRKMSKSYGNYTDPNDLMDLYSADALRFLLLSSPLLNGEDFSLQDKDVSDVARKLAMVWNMFDFFTLYAEVDNWEWNGKLDDPSSVATNPLDTWILSRLHQLTAHVDEYMQRYDIPNALEPILGFIDDASNWYIRRSRKRFWKSEDDADKKLAYQTLHFVLVRLSFILAPFTPFLAEELFQKLTGKESVHLENWPDTGHINELAIIEMQTIRDVITDGLAQRAGAGIKVRQPLKKLTASGDMAKLLRKYEDIVKEELNLRLVEEIGSESLVKPLLDLHITPDLKREGLMREIIRQVQNARKQAGLDVDDRIELALGGSEELQEAIAEHHDTIKAETLTARLSESLSEPLFEQEVKVENHTLAIKLKKHN
jgi:isoleucyl-tRNA synthetase